MPITIGDLKVYNVEEVAGLLQLQEKTVRRYLKEGRFHGRKVGNRWYISEDQLSEYFSSPEIAREAVEEKATEMVRRQAEALISDLALIQRELWEKGYRPLDEVEQQRYLAGCFLATADGTEEIRSQVGGKAAPTGIRLRIPLASEAFRAALAATQAGQDQEQLTGPELADLRASERP